MVLRDICFVYTGVPRSPDTYKYTQQGVGSSGCDKAASEDDVPSPDCPSPSGEASIPSQPIPTRVWVTIKGATEDGDPGRIEEAWYTVLDRVLVLADIEGRHIAEQKLLVDDDPARVARALLRARSGETEFNRPLPYRPLRLA